MQQIAPFSISCPTEIRFGLGRVNDVADLLPVGTKEVLLVQGRRDTAAAPIAATLRALGKRVTTVRCVSEPSVSSINAALEEIKHPLPQTVIACGGGSVIDTGKVLAFAIGHAIRIPDAFDQIDARLLARQAGVPLIAIPTTAGTGAEVTANAVLDVTSLGGKFSLRGRALFPQYAIVDPELTQGCPSGVTLRCGMDAVTQVIEAYTSRAATPFSDALTRPVVKTGMLALKETLASDNVQSRSHMAWVSLASGLALANAGLGAAHGLAAVLGSKLNAPHGALCGRLLAPVLRMNMSRAVEGTATHERLNTCHEIIANVFPPRSGRGPLSGLEAWLEIQGLPRLADWGVSRKDFSALAGKAVNASSSKKNAVDLGKADFRNLLEDAY